MGDARRPTEERERVVPMSFAQRRLWFLDEMARGNPFYNIPLVLPLPGRVDRPVLERAVNEIVRRHGSLRTTFRLSDGEPVQVVAPRLTVDVGHVRLDHLPPDERDRALQQLATDEARRLFDLRTGPLLRATLVSRRDDQHAILLTVHHIVADGWSVGIFVRELSTLYAAFLAGRPSPLPELPVQYADYAVWQLEHLSGGRLDALLAHWRTRLADLAPLELPTDRPRPDVLDYQGASHAVALSRELSDAVRELGRAHRATPFMVLLAAFVAVLQRYTAQDDVAVGIPIANRNRAETEDIIGFFVNSLLVRCDLSGGPTFAELLRRVRDECLDAYTHQDLPFEKLVEDLQPERDLGRNPLFQVTFQLVNTPSLDGDGAGHHPPGLEVQRGSAIFDLAFTLIDGPELRGAIEYSTQLFEPATIVRFAAHYKKLLAAVVTDPERRPAGVVLTTERERAALGGVHPTTEGPAPDVVAQVRAAAWAAPSAPAVHAVDATLTASEALARIDAVGARLAEHGAGRGSRVGLFLDHSSWTPVAMLGVLAVGATCVPLDPDYPPDRTGFMVGDAGCSVVLTERSVAGRLPDGGHRVVVLDDPPTAATTLPAPQPRPNGADAAYVIYTSGSTGTPRGVVVPRSALDNHMAWMQRAFPLAGDDRVLQRTSPCFDASVWELLAPLMAGAELVVLPSAARRDPAAVAGHLVTHGITVLQVVPTLLRALLDEPDLHDATALRRVFSGGEVLTAGLRDRFHSACSAELVNLYGPTEATIDATSHVSVPGDDRPTVPIGRPIDNVAAHVLDGDGNPVPIGVPGRLHLGGAALALGYHGHPRATAERFGPDPFGAPPGSRLLDTGDVVRYRSDGELEFLGRADGQLKVRGHRIEPSEIEATIDRAPGVEQSVVTAVAGALGDAELVAYLVPSDEAGLGGIVEDAEHDVLDRWREVYREVYAGVGCDDAVELNTVGWVSSFDGAPVPADAMAGWRDETVDRIRALEPRRVLEVGCGTGLILAQLAPDCERYVGTDFAGEVVDLLAARVAAPGSGLGHVELHHRPADDLADLGEAEFDVVVLNSVVQYFPGARYLRDVLGRAVRCVRPGGAVFVGDVRDLAVLDAFHVAVELARADARTSVAELVAAARRRAVDEEELVLDAGFFEELVTELPSVERCDVLMKADGHDNEMTWFRRDVVLRVGPDPRPEVAAERIAWVPGHDGEAIGSLLASTAGDAVVVADVADRRLAPLLDVLDAGAHRDTSLAPVRRFVADRDEMAGSSPTELAAVAARSGWRVGCEPCPGRPGTFDAVFVRSDLPSVRIVRQPPPPPRGPVANDPIRAAVAARLLPGVRAELARLPDHMTPSRFVLIDAVPRLPNGKLDRRRLPDPVRDVARRTRYAAPDGPFEELLAEVWSEVTGVPRVGTADDFFTELGGHSLMATRLVARLRAVLGGDVPLRLVFEAPTVAEFARRFATTPDGGRVERLAAHLDRLSDTEVTAWADAAAGEAAADATGPAARQAAPAGSADG